MIRLADPGGLVLAVPALLGFHPRESLVLLATGGRSGRRLGLTVRVDLPPPEHRAAAATEVVRALLTDAPAGAAVIVVDGRGGSDPPARGLVDLVVGDLEDRGVEVHAAIWAESTSAGARWGCYDPCGCVGALPDPSSTPLAAATVAGGQVVFAERAELERLVAPADVRRIRRREVALIRAIDDAVTAGPDINAGLEVDSRSGIEGRCGAAGASGAAGRSGTVGGLGTAAGIGAAGVCDPAAGFAVVEAAIADAAAARLNLDDERVLALAGALMAPAVRDAAMLHCAGLGPVDAAAAEQLWAALARETPDPEAAEPAALLAVSALLRGDGALANVALDRAEQAWPGHRLTRTLRSVAEVGMRPSEFRACLSGGS